MPVECAAAHVVMGQEEFHTIDRIVMGEVFAIHNSIGRFFDERIYQDELPPQSRPFQMPKRRIELNRQNRR